ncbi:MAG: hypothetical protein QN131_12090 [Armatimonadota bacterium]|nr:hypothetical protein [Armatimonadota bacterium]MDR7550657.1 hypothetical protein [Armatimonadota bacterium]
MRVARRDQRGMAMIVVLAITVVLTAVGIALVGLMHTDITHASIQHALTRSFHNAQAGLAEARAAVFAAADPFSYTNPSGSAGERVEPYGQGGQFTWWVDTGPATVDPCPSGLKTLEALGEAHYLGRWISSRVRACGVPGTPFLMAMFGVELVQAQGATSRTFIAPFPCWNPFPTPCNTPGEPTGGHMGSFREINFADTGLRLNAVSEQNTEFVTLREGTFEDFRLYGWTARPSYNANDPLPANLYAFGDIIKAQPTTGPISSCNPPSPYACVTVQNRGIDVQSICELRASSPTACAGAADAWNVGHVYMNRMTQQVLPQLCSGPLSVTLCDPQAHLSAASGNSLNDEINRASGAGVVGSIYTPTQFDQVVNYVASGCPGLSAGSPCYLRGTVFLSDTYRFSRDVNLGGSAGNVTLVVRGDLVLNTGVSVSNRHDLSTLSGRQTPGILVFGKAVPDQRASNVCAGEQANGSGRLILCGGNTQRLITDGLMFTMDGMAVGAQGTVDQIGAMYHCKRTICANQSSPEAGSYTNQNATVVVRFDPLSLRAIGRGIAITSWYQLK